MLSLNADNFDFFIGLGNGQFLQKSYKMRILCDFYATIANKKNHHKYEIHDFSGTAKGQIEKSPRSYLG